jgi:hypothetical protein
MKVQELLNQIRQIVREEVQSAMAMNNTILPEATVMSKTKKAPVAAVARKTSTANVLMEALQNTEPFAPEEVDQEWKTIHYSTNNLAAVDQSMLSEFKTNHIQDARTRKAIEHALTKDYSSMFKK